MTGKKHLQNKTIFLIFIVILIAFVFIGISLQRYSAINKNVFLVIRNSGSTNFPGYALMINSDGSGELIYQQTISFLRPNVQKPRNKMYPPRTFDISFTSHILTYIGSISGIPGHGCIKSASFGSVMTIVYNSQSSGDISCISSTDKQSYQQLKQQIDGYVAKTTN